MARKHKHRADLESFSMTTRNQIDGVHIRFEDREYVPAINVKPPRLYPRLPAELQEAPDQIRADAYEAVERAWWETVPQSLADEHLRKAFKGDEPETRQAGRSHGWLAVHGIRTPNEWTERQREAWDVFENAIKESIAAAELQWHDEIRERTAR